MNRLFIMLKMRLWYCTR